MGSDTTSPSLLSRLRRGGDGAAWREFDAKYGELVVRYCRRRGLQLADAEDLRQIVMARLARQFGEFHYAPQRGRFRSFLGRVVQNEISRYFGRPSIASRPVDDGVAAALAADVGDADRQWEQQWVYHHLRLAMVRIRETCSPRSVQVFERLLAGEPIEQVASAFGMETAAVHKVKARLRDRLKRLVAVQIREEDALDA